MKKKKRLWSIFNPLSLFNHYHDNCFSFSNVKKKKEEKSYIIFFLIRHTPFVNLIATIVHDS